MRSLVPFCILFCVFALLTPVALVRTQAPARKKLLFRTHAALYKHTSLGPAEHAVTELSLQGGFDVTTLEGYKQDSDKLDLAFVTPEYLATYDGLMLMTNGNLPLTNTQKRGIVDLVRNGKALIGVHCASLTLYDYPEFGEENSRQSSVASHQSSVS